jgi:hypothetical protein
LRTIWITRVVVSWAERKNLAFILAVHSQCVPPIDLNEVLRFVTVAPLRTVGRGNWVVIGFGWFAWRHLLATISGMDATGGVTGNSGVR